MAAEFAHANRGEVAAFISPARTGGKKPKTPPSNGCVPPEQPENEDPCPLLPTTFRTSKRVANIAEKPVPYVEETAETGEDRVVYKGPERVLRTAVSSMASSDEFGRMMKREAERRRFDKAPKRAFVGDGLNWNWSVWKKYFSSFVPF